VLRRRSLLFTSSAGAVLAPGHGRAQDKIRRVAVLLSVGERDPEAQARLAALREGLARLGWTEGRNLRLDVNYGAGDARRIRDHVSAFVKDAPDLIVVNSTPALDEVYKSTRTIPVVFVLANDPVGLGYIKSLARPGGNITGFTYWDVTLVGKWLQLLKEVAPATGQATFIHHPLNTPFYPSLLKAAEGLARTHGVELSRIELREPGDIEPAIRSIAANPRSSVIAGSDPFLLQNRTAISSACLAAKLPLISIFRVFAEAGALMTYGPDTVNVFRESASYVDRILRGANPGELPAQDPTTYEFAVNAATAQKLGLTLSPSVLARADQVIE
jgi:putative ABC transport system substrate-binding protein